MAERTDLKYKITAFPVLPNLWNTILVIYTAPAYIRVNPWRYFHRVYARINKRFTIFGCFEQPKLSWLCCANYFPLRLASAKASLSGNPSKIVFIIFTIGENPHH
jgi:hypothetical protein